jgi:adenylosuccinate synthase
VADLTDEAVLRERLEYVVPQKRAVVEEVYGLSVADLDEPAAFDVDALHEEFAGYGRRLAEGGMLVDAGEFLHEARADGETVMLEGAQGTLIDIDHGNYPYVTSSNPTAGGAATGTGLSPGVVGGGEVVGVVKAYLTRVGSGPLPTELAGVEGDTPGYEGDAGEEAEELATYIREEGGEYGTVTGRPRRVGWLDMPMLRHAARRSGFTGLALNHLDVLAGLDEVKVGHAYRLDGETIHSMPATTEAWARCEAEYRHFEGWPEADWERVAAEGYEALPAGARDYVEYVESELDTPAYAIGVGPDREATVVRETPV